MNSIKTKDINYGVKNEDEIFKILKNKFKDLKKSENKYSHFDFYNDSNLIELKTRRNSKNAYPTTMIGMNKINFFLNSNDTCYAFFSFTDGLYYIVINDDIIKKCNINNGGRCDRGYIENNKYLFIPVDLLKPCHILENHKN